MNKSNLYRSFLIIAIVAVCLLNSSKLFAQSSEQTDSTSVSLEDLKKQKEDLTEALKREEAKRGQKLEGVFPESMEKVNRNQDSICLELKSQLIDVELEIAENRQSVSVSTLVNKFNDLVDPKNKTQKNDYGEATKEEDL